MDDVELGRILGEHEARLCAMEQRLEETRGGVVATAQAVEAVEEQAEQAQETASLALGEAFEAQGEAHVAQNEAEEAQQVAEVAANLAVEAVETAIETAEEVEEVEAGGEVHANEVTVVEESPQVDPPEPGEQHSDRKHPRKRPLIGRR